MVTELGNRFELSAPTMDPARCSKACNASIHLSDYVSSAPSQCINAEISVFFNYVFPDDAVNLSSARCIVDLTKPVIPNYAELRCSGIFLGSAEESCVGRVFYSPDSSGECNSSNVVVTLGEITEGEALLKA